MQMEQEQILHLMALMGWQLTQMEIFMYLTITTTLYVKLLLQELLLHLLGQVYLDLPMEQERMLTSIILVNCPFRQMGIFM